MIFHNGLSRAVYRSVILLGMAILWHLFAPMQFGGQASYVIVAGASMEPSLRAGDLVIARTADGYEIGDVVTYHHPIVGPVIHRIIDKDRSTYTLQGDNNEWVDSYKPTSTDLVGKSWITLRGMAKWLQYLRSPFGIALLSLGIGFMVMITATQSRTKQSARGDEMNKNRDSTSMKGYADLRDGWFFVAGASLLGGILLSIIAFTKPTSIQIAVEIPYEHQGEFSYTAKAQSTIYDQGRIESGDAIFHAFIRDLETTFSYELASPALDSVSGTYRVVLEISEPNGWRRKLYLVPTTEFEGPSFSTSATINLDEVKEMIETLVDQTGFNRSVFDIKINPMVYIEATINDQKVIDRFTPVLHFKLDDFQLYVDGMDIFEQETNPFMPSEIRMISDSREVPNQLSFLGLTPKVSDARWIGITIVGIAFASMTVLLYPVVTNWRKSESRRIAIRYSDLILDVIKLPRLKPTQTMDVTSISDLVRIAESHQALIIHREHNNKHTYLVQLDEITYRFTLAEGTDK